MDKICSVSESVGRWVWMLSVRAGEEGEAARLKPPVAARGGVRGAARGGRQSIAGGRAADTRPRPPRAALGAKA